MEFSNNGITIKIYHTEYNLENIQAHRQITIPKIIFLDDRLRRLSYDKMRYDEHQVKRVFKGQTYLTFKVAQSFTDKGSMSLRIAEDDTSDYDALVKVSKREIRTKYPSLRIASKKEVYNQAKNECQDFLGEYEAILNGNVFSIIITDDVNGNTKEIPVLISGADIFSANLRTSTKDLFDIQDKRFKDFLTELFKQEEFRKMFNRFNNKIDF